MVDVKPEPEEVDKTNRLGLDIGGIELPSSEADRKELLAEIQESVDDVMESKGLDPSQVDIHAGHRYTEVPNSCPRCDYPLRVQNSTTEKEGKEVKTRRNLSLYCEQCGYSGGAVYQLVDIETNKYDPDRGAEVFRSEVTDRNIFPIYHSY